ncbi:MAG: hypothetical protein HUU41_04290 [Bryobacteraceae bacterium]|nr:hypothetical protein [Bryobacterales bacterium]NUN00309.1 hypothetical protein [Bryobacteraceae bacterium]
MQPRLDSGKATLVHGMALENNVRMDARLEAITLASDGQAPGEVYQEARTRFTEEELTGLTMAIIATNGWNRLCVGFRAVRPNSQPAPKTAGGGAR